MELTTVSIISLIIMAGMVVMLSGSFNLFKSQKDLVAITDSSRRILPAMTRMTREALHFVEAECSEGVITFYGDVDGGLAEGANAANIDVDNWGDDITGIGVTERVQFALVDGAVRINLTPPGQVAVDTDLNTAKLGSFVSGLKFFYFPKGITPGGADPNNPTGYITGTDINTQVGMIRIVVTLHKGGTTRSFHADVFLRITVR